MYTGGEMIIESVKSLGVNGKGVPIMKIGSETYLRTDNSYYQTIDLGWLTTGEILNLRGTVHTGDIQYSYRRRDDD